MTGDFFGRNKSYILFPTLIGLLFVICMIILRIERSEAMGTNYRSDEKQLYLYNTKEGSDFFKKIGYQELWRNNIGISKNSDGTALRFLNKEKKKILIAKCDGSIAIIDSPGYQTWLNDKNQPVVWLTWSDNVSMAHYANGFSEKMPFTPDAGHDPSGKYFYKDAPEKNCYTTIYSTQKPNTPLIKANLCGVTKLFVKDSKIYLIGKRFSNGSMKESEVHIFQEKGGVLETVSSMEIPKPDSIVSNYYMYYPVDLCPWSDEILFIHMHDFPTRSVYYTFDMKTRKLNKTGKMSIWGGWAFYLQCDILKKVVEEQKKEKERNDN